MLIVAQVFPSTYPEVKKTPQQQEQQKDKLKNQQKKTQKWLTLLDNYVYIKKTGSHFLMLEFA